MTERQGKVQMAFTRHLYPHKTLEDAVYALVVKDLDGAAESPTPTIVTLAIRQAEYMARQMNAHAM